MGIFKRVNDIAMANINEVLDKMENPLSMVKQYIRELEAKDRRSEDCLIESADR